MARYQLLIVYFTQKLSKIRDLVKCSTASACPKNNVQSCDTLVASRKFPYLFRRHETALCRNCRQCQRHHGEPRCHAKWHSMSPKSRRPFCHCTLSQLKLAVAPLEADWDDGHKLQSGSPTASVLLNRRVHSTVNSTLCTGPLSLLIIPKPS